MNGVDLTSHADSMNLPISFSHRTLFFNVVSCVHKGISLSEATLLSVSLIYDYFLSCQNLQFDEVNHQNRKSYGHCATNRK